jgi:hypothetical protein
LKTKQSPSQEISCLLRHIKVHYRVHKSQTMVPIMIQVRPADIFPPYIPKIHSNIFLPIPMPSEQSFQCTCHLYHSCYIPRPSHIRFNFPINSIDLGWTIGVLGFDSRRWLGIFLFTTASRTALGPTQTPILSNWYQGLFPWG